jgi:hypothetical protein
MLDIDGVYKALRMANSCNSTWVNLIKRNCEGTRQSIRVRGSPTL